MRYGVIGPGALGCLFASLLVKGFTGGDDHVWLLDHNRQRAAQINRQGLIYEKNNRREHLSVHACCSSDVIERVDVLFFCVKSYDLVSSLTHWRSLLQPQTLLLFLQNGIGHLGIGQYTMDAIPVFGTCSEGATLVGTGHVRHCGSGMTHLGFLQQTTDHAHSLLAKVGRQLNRCGLSTSISDNMTDRLWEKLFINVGINALTGIHQVPNGRLLESETIRKKMAAAILEAHQIALANHINVKEDPLQTTLDVCRTTAQNSSSMLQDIRKMRRTEIDAINGAIVEEGKRLGIKTPVNLELVREIKAIEKGYISSSENE